MKNNQNNKTDQSNSIQSKNDFASEIKKQQLEELNETNEIDMEQNENENIIPKDHGIETENISEKNGIIDTENTLVKANENDIQKLRKQKEFEEEERIRIETSIYFAM